jgi:hypothetical protein
MSTKFRNPRYFGRLDRSASLAQKRPAVPKPAASRRPVNGPRVSAELLDYPVISSNQKESRRD